jgi:preprotein translocase subunit SecB
MDVSAKIITQFVKDLSFENPMGPGAFQKGSERPAINANVDVKAANRKDTDIYEVELNINISAKREDKNVAYLLVECPRQLFPFARRIVYDMHADGSLPPLMLDPVNFADLYEKRKKTN